MREMQGNTANDMRRRQKGSGGVTKRTDGRWQATWTYRDENDCKRVKTLTGRTRKEALDKMRDWVAGGGSTIPAGKSVAKLVDHVTDVILPAQGTDPDTIRDYRAFGQNHIKPRIGTVLLEKLTVKHLDSIPIAMMAAGKSPKTAKNCRMFLAQCMKHGKRIGWLNKDLASDMMSIKTHRTKVDIYSLEQVLTLIEAADGARVQPAIVLAGLCGLREAECAGLMWSDLDLTKSTLKVQRQNKGAGKIKERTKTESGMRIIALPPFVRDYLKLLPKTSPFLMTSRDGRKPIHPSQIYHETRDLMESAELPRIRFHDLRHSANNVLKQLGVPAETRRDILGHSDTSVTENVYTQTVDWEMRDAMDKLEEALRLHA